MELTTAYFQKLIDINPFSKLLKMEIIEVEEVHIKSRMPLLTDYTNPYGGMHGGALYALADTIGGLCAVMATNNLVCTIDGHLNYLNAAENTDYIYCDSTLIRAGGKIIICDAKLTDDAGKVLCTGDFNYFRLKSHPSL